MRAERVRANRGHDSVAEVHHPFALEAIDTWETRFFVCHQGPVDLDVQGLGSAIDQTGIEIAAQPLRNSSVRCSLVRGQPTELVVGLALKPVFAGRLLDSDGTPIRNAVVHAAARSSFGPGSTVPHDPSEPGSAAIALVRTKGDPGVEALIQLSVTTDRDGAFTIPMSFSDRMAVWSFPIGYERVYQEHRLMDRFEGKRDLVLVAQKQRRCSPPTLHLSDSFGAPVGGVPRPGVAPLRELFSVPPTS